MQRRVGFTLLEMMIVIVIIGILATVGLAGYTKTIEKSRSQEAIANLRLIRAGERIYRVENARYHPNPDNTVWANNITDLDTNINTPLRLNIDYRNYNFSITSANSGSNFIAQATRNSGTYIGSCIQINQAGNWIDCGSWPFLPLPTD